MKRGLRRVLSVTLLLLALTTAGILPATAHGGGPAFYCQPGTLGNCTDTGNIATAEDTFSCEGEARNVVSCRDLLTEERADHCAFLGYEPGKDLDHYLCGSDPTQEGGNQHG